MLIYKSANAKDWPSTEALGEEKLCIIFYNNKSGDCYKHESREDSSGKKYIGFFCPSDLYIFLPVTLQSAGEISGHPLESFGNGLNYVALLESGQRTCN